MRASLIDEKRIAYKAKLRQREFDLIFSFIEEVIPKELIGKLKILEFGCGTCKGSRHLCMIGQLVVTDIYKDPRLNLPPGVQFKIADIHKTDFSDDEFDVIVSSQVLEHLEDISCAFREMKRIAKVNAYYIFSVPTSFWLIFSIPGQVFKKLENIAIRIRDKNAESSKTVGNYGGVSHESLKRSKGRWLNRFLLCGHARYPGFFECLLAFTVRNWRSILYSNGFQIVKEKPLLNYTAHLPFIPANRALAKLGLASSYLFICRILDNPK